MALCLITGVAGFIGSSLAHAVLAQGDEVRGIDNFSTGKRENLSEILNQIDLREADLSEAQILRRLIALAPFRRFVRANEEPLRRIAQNSTQLRWALRYIDFIVRTNEDVDRGTG